MESISKLIVARRKSEFTILGLSCRGTRHLYEKNMFYNNRQYYVYILTNYKKTVLYTSVTNNLEQRIIEHSLDKGNIKTFTGKYNCFSSFIMNVHNTLIMLF